MEFAQVVTVAVGLMMGAIEIGWQFLASIALENAALEASRTGSLGRANADGSRRGSACESEVKQAAVAAGAGILKASRLTLTPMQYATASELVDEKTGTRGTGTAGSFVMYTLTYDQPLLFFGDNAVFKGTEVKHYAKAAVMNEPYPNANAPTPCPA